MPANNPQPTLQRPSLATNLGPYTISYYTPSVFEGPELVLKAMTGVVVPLPSEGFATEVLPTPELRRKGVSLGYKYANST